MTWKPNVIQGGRQDSSESPIERELSAAWEKFTEDFGKFFIAEEMLMVKNVFSAYVRSAGKVTEAEIVQQFGASAPDLLARIRMCLDDGKEPPPFAPAAAGHVEELPEDENVYKQAA